MLELANAPRRRASSAVITIGGNTGSGLLLCLLFLIAFSPLHVFFCIYAGVGRDRLIVGERGNAEQRSEGIDIRLGSINAFDPYDVHASGDEVWHLVSNPQADQRRAQARQNGNLG